MKANGESRQSIEQCSCSIDVVASIIPYDRYVTAETVLSMSQVRGNLGGQFRLIRAGRECAQRPQARPGRGRGQVLLASAVSSRTPQVPGFSTFHSCSNTWPSVSLASARTCLAPFET